MKNLVNFFGFIYPLTWGGGYIIRATEDTSYAFQQMGEEPLIIVFVILNIILVGGMNGLGMAVTKYASAANRVTLQQSKVIIIWLFFLLVPIKGKEEFRILQLIGFLLLLCGIVLFNEIIELPIFGFNRFTKKALERNKLRAKSLNYEEEGTDIKDESDSSNFTNDATNYTPSSPNRYDYQRNYKRVKDRMETKADHNSKGDYMKMEGVE